MTATPDAKPLKGLFIRTYGCQMNVYDSERIRDVLKPLGYAPVEAPEGADLVVINTCHIREKATEKVYSELGKLKQMKLASGGKMTIAVAGCVAQAEGAEIIRRQPAVDLVLGPQAYHKLPEMIARASRAVGDRLETEFDTVEKFDALPKTRDPDGPAAFVSVTPMTMSSWKPGSGATSVSTVGSRMRFGATRASSGAVRSTEKDAPALTALPKVSVAPASTV